MEPESQPVTSKTIATTSQQKRSKSTDSESTPGKKPKFYDKEIKCTECDFVTDKRLLFKKHCILNHADKFDTTFLLNHYKCDFCDKVFKDPIQLSNHKNVHLGLKPYSCVECEHLFTTRGELIRHTRYKHTLERPHKCELCDYSSVELSKLKRHMRVHTDERPYLCPYCEYASRDTFKLKRHLRVHTGEKPYECPICKTCFSQCNSLKVHMKSSHKDGSRIQNKIERSSNKNKSLLVDPNESSEKSSDLNKSLSPINKIIKMPEVTIKSDPSTPQPPSIKTSAYYKANEESYYSNQNYLTPKKSSTDESSSGSTYRQVDITEIEDIYTCTECAMKFTSSQLLDEHFVKHTGDRPFVCGTCNMNFGHKFSLQAHMLSHDEKYSKERKKNMKTISENTQSTLNSSAEKSPDVPQVKSVKALKKVLTTKGTKNGVSPRKTMPAKSPDVNEKVFSIFQKKSDEIPPQKDALIKSPVKKC